MGASHPKAPRPASTKFAPANKTLIDRLSMNVPRITSLSRKKKRRLVIIGLDSAGKTTILNLLMKKEAGATLPTEGFNAETLKYKGDDKNLELTLWDLGGQDKLRQMWRHYYQGVQGIVFVVDATDVDRLGLAAKELQAALQDESLNAAGLLILCNKRDLKGAKSDAEISVMLGLDGPQSPTMALLGSRPFKLCSTSAEKDADSVFAAVDWLCSVMQPL